MIIDLIYGAILLFYVARGYNKGFVIALFAFVSFVVAAMLSLRLSATLALGYFGAAGKWAPVCAYIITFVSIVLLVRILGKSITGLLNITPLGFVNRAMGVLLYALLVTFLYSIFVWLLDKAGFLPVTLTEGSLIFPLLLKIPAFLMEWVGKGWPFFRRAFEDLEHYFSRFELAHVDFNR